MKSVDLKIALLLALICFIGGLFVLPYQLDLLQKMMPEEYEVLIKTMPFPTGVLQIISALQLAIISFIVAFTGIKIARKTGFSLNVIDSIFNKGRVKFDKNGALLAVLFGCITALMLAGTDRFHYQNRIPLIGETEPEFSWIGLMVGVFYGGVFEELLMRLFFMSLLIWLFMKVVKRSKEQLASVYYWIAITIAAGLFAAGHLPTTELLFGELTMELIIRCFLLNGIGGLFFGYLYWKKGFEYAILAHMISHVSLQLIFIPFFY